MAQELTAPIHRDLALITQLLDAGHLGPERLAALVRRIHENLGPVDVALEAIPAAFGEEAGRVIAAGLPVCRVRFAGRFAVIEGDRA